MPGITAAPGNVPGWLRVIKIIAGIVLVILSIMAWGNPLIAERAFVFIFGLALVVLGTMRMGDGIFGRSLSPGVRVLLVVLGMVLVGIGFFAIAVPPAGALTMIYFFAFALMLAGLDRLAMDWGGIPGPVLPSWARYFSIIAGIFAILAGFVILFFPGLGAALLFAIIAIVILILGIEMVVSGIRGRRIIPA
jgi:uncharacterized membrane protein HdeD (DUF308 family)